MRSILSERNIVIVLFAMVLVTFSLAHEDSKKMERSILDAGTSVASRPLTAPIVATTDAHEFNNFILVPHNFPQ